MAIAAGVSVSAASIRVAQAAGAGAQAKRGDISTRDFGSIKIHSYLSGPDGLTVNSHIVEGPTKLVVFDGQLLLSYANEFADYIQRLDKPVERIILSHGHPDHWSGLEALRKRFPDCTIQALSGVAEAVQARGNLMLGLMSKLLSTDVAKSPTVPTHILAEGSETIDGVRYEFKRIVDAEYDLQLLALLPDQKVMIAFDVVFSPNDHAFTVANHFQHWISVLEDLDRLTGYETIIIGHSRPTERPAIRSTIEYLEKAKAAFAACPTPEEYSARLKAEFPGRSHPEWADFSSKVLYLSRQRK